MRPPKIKMLFAAVAAFALVAVPVQAQTNVTTETIWDVLTSGTNYFVIPYGASSTAFDSFGGGLAVGYTATPALAPVVRIEDFAGKVYVASISLQLQVPRTFMGKVPVVPFALAGAAVPVDTALVNNSVTISAGDPIAIAGVGAYIPLDWVGSGWFWQHAFPTVDYEHWTGANLPSNQQNQIRFGIGIHF